MSHRVLVVEDSREYRQLVSRTLKEAGYDVCTAADGRAGLEQFEQARPAAVLCDVMLPGMSGFGLLEKVRQHDRRLPFILTSTWDNETAREHARDLGADAFIPKDLDAGHLLRTLKRCLSFDLGAGRIPPVPPAQRPAEQQWRMTFDNRLDDALTHFCRQARPLLAPLDATKRVRLAEAAGQAIRVAICCGNLEFEPERLHDPSFRAVMERRALLPPYQGRKVHVLGVRRADCIRLCIADQGPGFDYRELAETQLGLAGYLFGSLRFSPDGRCFQLIHELNDGQG